MSDSATTNQSGGASGGAASGGGGASGGSGSGSGGGHDAYIGDLHRAAIGGAAVNAATESDAKAKADSKEDDPPECGLCLEPSPGKKLPCCGLFVCDKCSTKHGAKALVLTRETGMVCFGCKKPVADFIDKWAVFRACPDMEAIIAAGGRSSAVEDRPPAAEAAWTCTFPCSHCGVLLSIDASDGCDVVLCRACNQQTNLVDPSSNVHTFTLRDFLGAMAGPFEIETVLQNITQNWKPFVAARLQEAMTQAVAAFVAGDIKEVERIRGLLQIGGFSYYVGYIEHVLATITKERLKFYQQCVACPSLAALVKLVRGHEDIVPAADLAELEAIEVAGDAKWPVYSDDNAGHVWTVADEVIRQLVFEHLVRPAPADDEDARIANWREEIRAAALLRANNCLIAAVARAAGRGPASDAELLTIRTALNNIGQMMVANEFSLDVIRGALGIANPIHVYNQGEDLPEEFDGIGQPITIHNTGARHFEDGLPPNLRE